MDLLQRLQGSSLSYGDLLNGSSREWLDSQLRILCKAQQIILRHDGKYSLWPKQPPDNPILVGRTEPHSYCPTCGNGVYRKDSICCSAECRRILQTKKRPNCKVCGISVNRMRSKYCSKECQDKGMTSRMADRQTCRKCRREKNLNQFPSACRGYPRSLCYSCVRNNYGVSEGMAR